MKRNFAPALLLTTISVPAMAVVFLLQQPAAAKVSLASSPAVQQPATMPYPQRVYWGDTHLHTRNSTDAFGFGNRLGPEDALRFARGEEVTSSTGIKAKLARPLDFLVIADHADGYASFKDLYSTPRDQITDPTVLKWYDQLHQGPEQSLAAFNGLVETVLHNKVPPAMLAYVGDANRVRTTWEQSIDAVEHYNQPGTFTAFHGFEYTLQNGGSNLHRNVIFRDNADRVRSVLPFAAPTVTPDPLWDYMDAYEKNTGGKVLAIPHNSNLSNGWMFMNTQPDGAPMSAAYARRRAAHEPVVEITQMKGDSEAHPFLSTNDEFAGYGKAGWELGNIAMTEKTTKAMLPGNYVREALKRGLQIEQRSGVNPYRFGVVGSTDSHTSLATSDENNFFGKHPGAEPGPNRVTEPLNMGPNPGRFGWNYLSSGYAAVWATANTRAAIFDALMRREVYGTTGPRMTVRLFGGWDFVKADLKGDWVNAGYARGVPMGGNLGKGRGGAPRFIVSALKDPDGANLDRVQIVKGWVDRQGRSHEHVFDVTWSDAGRRRIVAGKLQPVGDTVDLAKASYTNTIGTASLSTVWTDPAFDPRERAFYYVRVLEIPTPTWIDFDMVRYGLKLDPGMPLKQQERAYTSAIWYSPA